MKNIAIAVFAAVVGLGMMVQDAEAKRLGGGKSAGMQRQAPRLRPPPHRPRRPSRLRPLPHPPRRQRRPSRA